MHKYMVKGRFEEEKTSPSVSVAWTSDNTLGFGNNRYESQPAYERAGFLLRKHTQLETEVVKVELVSLQEEGGGRGK